MTTRRILLLVFGSLCLPLALWPLAHAENLRNEPPLARHTTQGKLAARRTAVVLAVERVRAAVVNIRSERTLKGSGPGEVFTLSPSQNRVNGMGTGIIVDPRGYIVTNQHVVEDVNVLRITLADGASLSAQVVARSAANDLALLKVDAGRPLATMPLGTAADLMVGETVIAIGNAYGYEHTVSQGIVSAVKRDVTLNKEVSYKSLIQTDASINPGNSGGPLVNIHGDLIGVNVAIRAGAQGIGFAIPVDTMVRVVCDLMRSRRKTIDGLVCRDRLLASEDGLSRDVVVERVEPDSPAASAGLKPGDVIFQAAGLPVRCSYDVQRALLDKRPGDSAAFTLHRDDKEMTLSLVLQASTAPRPGAAELIWRKLGLRLMAVAPDAVGRANRQLNGGLEVTAVDPSSPAARAGIHRGDILVGLHQWETLSLDNVVFVLTHADLASFNPLSFYIVRGGQVRHGWMQQVE
jgi:serine protease Do